VVALRTLVREMDGVLSLWWRLGVSVGHRHFDRPAYPLVSEDGTLEIAARRNWPAATGSRPAKRTPRLPRGAVLAAWRALIAPVPEFGSASVDRRLDRPTGAAAAGRFAESGLVIRRGRHESGLHLIVSGELDAVTASQLREQCERADPEEADTVLLDLADLTVIDSSGLDVLFAAFAHFGERLVIILGPPGARAIELANARGILPIIEG
jgi:anti-anti-sigma factor